MQKTVPMYLRTLACRSVSIQLPEFVLQLHLCGLCGQVRAALLCFRNTHTASAIIWLAQSLLDGVMSALIPLILNAVQMKPGW